MKKLIFYARKKESIVFALNRFLQTIQKPKKPELHNDRFTFATG
jgi:hypothetical protein